jgi:hypothetical protein
MSTGERGASLVVGLVLMSIVALLGLAGASAAHVEQLLAQNETFRENAAIAASAGIEVALRAIVNSPAPDTVTPRVTGNLPVGAASYQATIRFIGYEYGLPQIEGAQLAGAHFEIESTGQSARNAVDRQRAQVLRVVTSISPVAGTACEPQIAQRCRRAGEWRLQSWQRVPAT